MAALGATKGGATLSYASAGAGATDKTPGTRVRSCCQFCQVRCTFDAQVQGDTIISFMGDKDNYWTKGTNCPKGLSLLELVNRPDRLLYPLIRDGSGWKKVSYNLALAMIAERIITIRDKYKEAAHGKVALFSPLWDCREGELAAALMMRSCGFSNIMSPGETCIASASKVLSMMLGSPNSTTTIDEVPNTDVLVLWGANIAETMPPYVQWILKARESGTKVVYLDCRSTPTSNIATQQLRPRPGTDGALALGLARLMMEPGRLDEMHLQDGVKGVEAFRKGIDPYTPEHVSSITGLTVQDIVGLADIFAASERSIVWLGGCLSRYTNGISTLRAIVSLQGIMNRLGGTGNGLLTMEGGKPGDDEEFIESHPGPKIPDPQNMRRLTRLLEQGEVEVVLLNASYRRYPDANTVKAAIRKAGLVVHRGFFMNAEASLADIIIPSTMALESEGSQFGAERQVYWREKAIEPRGETVEDWRFYRDLGKAVVGQVYPDFSGPRELYERFVARVPSWGGMGLDRLRAAPSGVMWPCSAGDPPMRTGSLFRDGRLMTEDGKLNLDLSALGPIGWTLPKGSPKEKGAPADYPLVFTQGKIAQQWQQSLTNCSAALAQFANGRYVQVHPDTAQARGLADGDTAFIQTALGRLEARVRVTEGILPGVVFTPSHFCPNSPHEATRGEAINTITPNYWDRISAQFNGFGCQLIKKD